MQKAAKIKVGDLILEAYAADGEANFQLSPAHAPFQVNGAAPIYPEFPFWFGTTLPMGQLVFDSGGVWSLYENPQQVLIPLSMPDSGDPPMLWLSWTALLARGGLYSAP